MDKFVPVEKLSKKARRAYFARSRSTWTRNPVTRCPQRPGAYDRSKVRQAERKEERAAP